MSLAKTLDALGRHAELPPRALPTSCFTDKDFWNAEVEHVLRPGWHAIARKDELPNRGDFRSVDLYGEPIVLVRDDSDRLRAFSRVCLHRSAVFVEGDGNTKRFTCPYHRWGYDLAGRLCAAPLMDAVEGFDRNVHRLPELPLEEWLGFVLVSLDPNPTPFSAGIENIAKAFEPLDFSNFRIAGTTEYSSPWNWKVLIENFIESYHHLGTHSGTLQPSLPAAGTFAVDLPDEGVLLDNPGVDGDPGAWVSVVFPTLLFFVSRDDALPVGAWYQLDIDSIDHFHLKTHVLLPPAIAENEEIAKGSLEFIDSIHREDIEACTLIQRGLTSRLFEPTALALQEAGVARFHRYLAEKMSRAAER